MHGFLTAVCQAKRFLLYLSRSVERATNIFCVSALQMIWSIYLLPVVGQAPPIPGVSGAPQLSGWDPNSGNLPLKT